jgi:hypothetical protein
MKSRPEYMSFMPDSNHSNHDKYTNTIPDDNFNTPEANYMFSKIEKLEKRNTYFMLFLLVLVVYILLGGDIMLMFIKQNIDKNSMGSNIPQI